MGSRMRTTKAKTAVMVTSRTAIITVGNELMGDDGIGPAVFKALELTGLPTGVSLIDGGTGGLGVLHLMSDYDRVIIVDCCDFGGKAGNVMVFRPEDVHTKRGQAKFSLHSLDLLELIEFGKQLGKMPKDLVMVGVQPKKVGMGEGLSAPVKKAVSSTVKAVLCVLDMPR